jgi:UDP-N-acetylglucosamine 4,6-dehydratase
MSYKTILITGGTGSFGKAVIHRLLKAEVDEIRVFSRDEKKQDDLRKELDNPKVKYFIGDVRDLNSIKNSIDGVDYVFHAAALKQVPSCEFFPMEAFKTNVLGTENVLEAAALCDVKKVVCLSTDKAVYPINAMGCSKAMMEKVAIAKSRTAKRMVITVTRYGNVMASRGSVIPLFIHQIRNNKPVTITDPRMTRFMMTLEDAVELVLHAFKFGEQGEILVQKSPAGTIKNIALALLEIFNCDPNRINIIGARHAEKLHEVLIGQEEMLHAIDIGEYYCIKPDVRDLNYTKYSDAGNLDINSKKAFCSQTAEQLDLLRMRELILKCGVL